MENNQASMFNKTLMIHVFVEVVVISCISLYFSKRISVLEDKIITLESSSKSSDTSKCNIECNNDELKENINVLEKKFNDAMKENEIILSKFNSVIKHLLNENVILKKKVDDIKLDNDLNKKLNDDVCVINNDKASHVNSLKEENNVTQLDNLILNNATETEKKEEKEDNNVTSLDNLILNNDNSISTISDEKKDDELKLESIVVTPKKKKSNIKKN